MSEKRETTLGGALSFGLGVCLLLWLIPDWVEPDPDLRLPVSLVPQIVAIGFVLCGLGMIVRSLFAGNVASEIASTGFDAGEFRGLLVMIGMLLVATIGFQFLHFLIVAPVIVGFSMWVFSPVRPVSLILTSALGPFLTWVLATQVLGRVLP